MEQVSFLVAVPPVVLPTRINGRGSARAGGSANISVSTLRQSRSLRAAQAAIEPPSFRQYTHELDMAYFAKVEMAGGDVVEIAAGQTTFVPPAMWSPDTVPDPRRIHRSFNGSSFVQPVQRNSGFLQEPKVVTLERLNASLTLERVPNFVQGE